MNAPVVNALIQARMGSSRLPGKVMTEIAGEPLLAHVVRAVNHATKINNIIICTTDRDIDDEIESWACANDVDCVRGSEADVLDRFCVAIKRYPSDYIVRITADDPLLDPGIIDKVIEEAVSDLNIDYCSNIIKRSWPRGLDCEVVKSNILLDINTFVTRPEDREHVTIYIRTNPEKYMMHTVVSPEKQHRPNWRFCIDTEEDLIFVQEIYSGLKEAPKPLRVETVIEYIDQKPELTKINQDVQQTAVLGYEY